MGLAAFRDFFWKPIFNGRLKTHLFFKSAFFAAKMEILTHLSRILPQ